jgi:hypothetical protein
MLIHDQKTEILYEVVVNDEEQYSIWLTRVAFATFPVAMILAIASLARLNADNASGFFASSIGSDRNFFVFHHALDFKIDTSKKPAD